MKLIIDMPEDIYREMLKSFDLYKKEHEKICYTAIANGIPQEKTGHWIIHSDYDAMECDKCGKLFSEYDYNDFNYCPNCGCRMINPKE